MTLTGSVGAGRAVAAQAGAVGKKVVLELGGSDPFIVLPSADLDRAVPVGRAGAGPERRPVVHRRQAVHRPRRRWPTEFTERFVAAMAALSVGDPFDPATEVGPLINAAAVDGIEAQVEDARAKGATILCGGERVVGPGGPDRPGCFYRPTVVTDIAPGMRVATEEVFGPVALLYRWPTPTRPWRWPTTPSSDWARACGPNDPDEQQRFVTGLQAGQVFVNGMTVSMPQLPVRRHQELGHRSRAVVVRAARVLQREVGLDRLMAGRSA